MELEFFIPLQSEIQPHLFHSFMNPLLGILMEYNSAHAHSWCLQSLSRALLSAKIPFNPMWEAALTLLKALTKTLQTPHILLHRLQVFGQSWQYKHLQTVFQALALHQEDRISYH